MQKIAVKFYANIARAFTKKGKEVTIEESLTVEELLDTICNTYEQRQSIFDNSGRIKSEINILKNGRNIDFLEGLCTRLKNGDKVAIFPPVFGG